MQASTFHTPVFTNSLSTTGETTAEAARASQQGHRFAILASLILMVSAIPQAGVVPATELRPLDGASSEDLSLDEVAAHFEKRLPAGYKQESKKLGRLLLQLCDQYQFSPTFILSVIETESTYRVNARSRSGAVGLMQLLPNTAREMGAKFKINYEGDVDLYNPATNLKLGVAYLSWLRRQFGHSVHYVAAYNVGPTALKRRLASGDYELGAIDRYVRTIHERTWSLREQHTAPVALPAIHRDSRAALLSAAL